MLLSQPSPLPWLPVFQHCISRGIPSLTFLFWLAYLQKLVIYISCPGLAPASHLLHTQLNFTSKLIPGYLLLFLWPVHLLLGISSSFTIWKTSLKICQFYSTPFSLSVSPGNLLMISQKRWKFAFLKLRGLTLHLT